MSGFEILCLVGGAVFVIHQYERHQEEKAYRAERLKEFDERWENRRDEWRP
jgi:hypothetical protein